MTGVFAFEVAAKFGPGDVGNPNPGGYFWAFKPLSPGAAADIAASALTNLKAEIATWTAGTMMANYDDMTLDYTRLSSTLSADDLLLTANGGTLMWEAGFNGGTDLLGNVGLTEVWTAEAASDDVAVVGATPPPGNGGTVNFSVTQLSVGPAGVVVAPVAATVGGTTSFNGSADLLGTAGVDTPFDAFDNLNMTFMPIPEPTSVMVWGLLGSVAFVLSRRRK
jgi:hypothetical protein